MSSFRSSIRNNEGHRESLSFIFSGKVSPSDVPIEKTISIMRSYNRLAKLGGAAIYGSRNKLDVRATHLRHGSYDFSGILSVVGGLQPLLPMFPALSLGVSSIPKYLKIGFDLLKSLKGSPPKSVKQSGDGKNVNVENRDGIVFVLNGNIYTHLVMGDFGKEAAALKTPISMGSDGLTLKSNSNVVAEYTSEDVSHFVPFRPAQDPITTEMTAFLTVVSPVLQGDGRWRFKFGDTNIVAEIDDKDYLDRVNNRQIAFASGDYIRARLRITQVPVGSKIETRHQILQVEDKP